MPDLVFQQMTLPALERDDGLWLRATDLARALGYPREDNVSRLYRRHADEFTDSMTRLVQLPRAMGFGDRNGPQTPEETEGPTATPNWAPVPEETEGRLTTQNCVVNPDELATELEPQNGVPILKTQDARNPLKSSHNATSEFRTERVRIFSLRGCHLLAMFARTPVAKAFRRWVLDVLDALNAPGFSRVRLARAMNLTEAIELICFDAGRIQGRLDRLTPERQTFIYSVCGMLDDGILSRKQIAARLHVSRYVIDNIARRYWKGMTVIPPWSWDARKYAPESKIAYIERLRLGEEPSHD